MSRINREIINERLKENKKSFSLLGCWKGYKNKTLWECNNCQQTWESTPHTVIMCKHGCPHCNKITNETVDLRLSPLKIRRLTPFTKVNDPMLFKCEVCKHEWETKPNKIFSSGTRCPKCSKKQPLTNEIVDERLVSENILIKRIGEISGTHKKLKWGCTKNLEHVWETTPVAILSHKTGCPHCYAENGGRGIPTTRNGIWFRSTLEASVYDRLLEKFPNTEIVTQKRYNKTTKHTCDFYLPLFHAWIEVSNYTSYNYLQNIEKKRNWVKQINENFFFIKSSKEVDLISFVNGRLGDRLHS